MQFSTLIGKEDLERFKNVRWRSYSDRAVSFLQRRFPTAIQPLSTDALCIAIHDAAIETRQLGLRSERDHLSFLIARIMLGRRFLLNPLYIDFLYAAGWIDDTGQPARHFAFGPLFEQIASWDHIRSADMKSARGLAIRFARLYQPNAPTGIAAIHATLPACAAAIRPELLIAFHDTVTRAAQEVTLSGPDLESYCCAAVLIGIEPHKDPFFAGIANALAPRAFPREERRLAFGLALQELLLARIGNGANDEF